MYLQALNSTVPFVLLIIYPEVIKPYISILYAKICEPTPRYLVPHGLIVRRTTHGTARAFSVSRSAPRVLRHLEHCSSANNSPCDLLPGNYATSTSASRSDYSMVKTKTRAECCCLRNHIPFFDEQISESDHITRW